MTDNSTIENTGETVEQPQETHPRDNPQDPEIPQEGQGHQADAAAGTLEAKKYRKRAQEAEAKLKAAEDRVETLERTEVERAAAALHLARPGGIWKAGLSLDQIRDEDGSLTSDTARANLKEWVTEIGLATDVVPPNPAQSAEPAPEHEDQWTGAFRF